MKNLFYFLTLLITLSLKISIEIEASCLNSVEEMNVLEELNLNSIQLRLCCKHPHSHCHLNSYKLLLTVGMDELLSKPALTFGLKGFKKILGWNTQTIEEFRQAAIAYFNERFGIDFINGIYDPYTGITTISYATLLPATFKGNYRVLCSNNCKIPAMPVSYIRVVEFFCMFNEQAIGKFYAGTYANAGPVPINPTDSLNYGVYRIYLSSKCNVKHHYDFFSRSYYPSVTQPINVYPTRISETLQLFSSDFGPGSGFLNLAAPLTPDSHGCFPTFVRGSFSFPGSFVLSDLNGYLQPPIIKSSSGQ